MENIEWIESIGKLRYFYCGTELKLLPIKRIVINKSGFTYYFDAHGTDYNADVVYQYESEAMKAKKDLGGFAKVLANMANPDCRYCMNTPCVCPRMA